jgi:hypothetical protein
MNWFACRAACVFIATLATLSNAFFMVAQGGGGRGGAMAATFDPHDISGYWELGPDGKSVPAANLAPNVTKAILDKMALQDLISFRWCRPLGLPAMMDNGRPLDIQQGRWEILMVPEANSSPRHLYFDRPHIDAKIFDPASVGDSVAHWEGDTLIVDTVGFHPRDGRMLIPGGGFRTERSHLVERYKLLKNGSVLSVTFTWTDPKVFQTPHTYEFRYTKVPGRYEPRNAVGCDPFDPERTEFVERTFTPAQKQAAEAESIEAKQAARRAAARAATGKSAAVATANTAVGVPR